MCRTGDSWYVRVCVCLCLCVCVCVCVFVHILLLAPALDQEVAETYGDHKDDYVQDMNKMLQNVSDQTREAYLSDKLEAGLLSGRVGGRPVGHIDSNVACL